MSHLTCLLLPHEDADGPANMARDEAMLDLVAAEPGCAAFRTYGWTEPTLSLGYFQAIRDVELGPRWQGVPLVRRPTGGGAILHDREVTYALAVPKEHPLAKRTAALYRQVHEAIMIGIREVCPEARRRGEAPVSNGPRPFLCFSDRDPEDLVVGPDKVVGSAQRRRSGAVLQHGSILVARSPLAAELAGLADVSTAPADIPFWSERLRRLVPGALGLVPWPSTWPEAVLRRACEIENAVYRSPAWTRRR